ncbi:uridylate kinase [Xylaria sp. FL1777]|nr:uridylate kinase [Xylaria sp. FL1777]
MTKSTTRSLFTTPKLPATRAKTRGSTIPRRTYSAQPPRGPNATVKFWPFLAIIVVGTGAFAYVSKSRANRGKMPAVDDLKNRKTPVFSADDVTVLFVLGGPGAGKGTQCERLVAAHGFTHLSAGDLLRAEQNREGSQYGELIKDYIKNGQIVPMEVTIALLENAMREAMSSAAADNNPTTTTTTTTTTITTSTNNSSPPADDEKKSTTLKGKFLIDGFPRKFDQAVKFEEAVCPARFVLFYDCPEEEMERRLLERGKTSGRADDNAESIRKRFRTFVETSMPVVDYYEKQGRVARVRADVSPDDVYRATQAELTKRLGDRF